MAADHMLHKGIADHKVGGRSVLIYEKQMGTCLHALHNSGSLGGTSAGVRGGEAAGVLFIGKVIDEHGNIHILYKTSVLGAPIHRSVLGGWRCQPRRQPAYAFSVPPG